LVIAAQIVGAVGGGDVSDKGESGVNNNGGDEEDSDVCKGGEENASGGTEVGDIGNFALAGGDVGWLNKETTATAGLDKSYGT
jgi:hypothetical protein